MFEFCGRVRKWEAHKSKNFWKCTDVVRWQPIASLEFCYQFSPLLPPTEWCHRVFVSLLLGVFGCSWLLCVVLVLVGIFEFWWRGHRPLFPPNPSLTLLWHYFPAHFSWQQQQTPTPTFPLPVFDSKRISSTTTSTIHVDSIQRLSISFESQSVPRKYIFLKKHVLFQRHPRKERPTG